MRGLRHMGIALVLCVALSSVHASADDRFPKSEAVPTREVPGLDRISVDEQLNKRISLDVPFRDQDGREVRLADYFKSGKPVLLTFAYHSCPTLCSMVLDAMVKGISGVDWSAGDQYELVNISIDPRDTVASASKKREELLRAYDRPTGERGFHFLVGDDDAIKQVTDAVGFRYFYNSAQKQYAHPAVLIFLTPEGMVARYIYGLEFASPSIRMALLEASQGRSISTTEQILLYCYAYDADANGYVLMATRVMKAGGVVTMLLLGAFLGLYWRRERRSRLTS